jgi:hypothetical protein
MVHHLPVRRHQEARQPDVDACFPAGRRQRLYRHLGAGEAGVPAIRLAADRDGLGRPLQGAGPAHTDTPDLGEDQDAVLQLCAIAELLVGEAVVAVFALESRVARLLARPHPAEEGGKRFVQAGEHILQHLAVDGGVCRKCLLDGGQCGLLLRAGGAVVRSASPARRALFAGHVIKRATAPYDLGHRRRLLRGGPQLVFVGLARRLRFHTSQFCLMGETPVRGACHASPA